MDRAGFLLMYPKHLKQYMAHNRCSNKYLLKEFLGRRVVIIIGFSCVRERAKLFLKEGNRYREGRSKLPVMVFRFI